MNIDQETGVVYRKWECSSPDAVFLLLHGLGAYSGRWVFLADFFLQHNISSYAIDFKGFGHTEELKGHIDSFQTYYNDIQSLCDIIKKEHNGKKVFLAGESMGALIAFIWMALKPHLFDGFICISPAFKSKLKFNFSDYIKIFFFLVFGSKKQFIMPFDMKMCTSDADCQKAIEEDAQEHKLATSKLLYHILLAQMRARIFKSEIKAPVLFLIPGKDDITDSRTAEKIFEGLCAQDKQIVRYPQMRHALSVESQRQDVFEDILKWIDFRMQGSG